MSPRRAAGQGGAGFLLCQSWRTSSAGVVPLLLPTLRPSDAWPNQMCLANRELAAGDGRGSLPECPYEVLSGLFPNHWIRPQFSQIRAVPDLFSQSRLTNVAPVVFSKASCSAKVFPPQRVQTTCRPPASYCPGPRPRKNPFMPACNPRIVFFISCMFSYPRSVHLLRKVAPFLTLAVFKHDSIRCGGSGCHGTGEDWTFGNGVDAERPRGQHSVSRA